jgi:hypothetical protein
MPDQIREGLRILGERRQRDRQERHRNAQARENERLAQLIRTVAPAAPATTTSRPATESGARSDALDPAGLPLDRPSRADRGREATIEVKTEGVKRERMAMPPTPPLRRRNLQQQRDDAEFVPRPVRPVSPCPGLWPILPFSFSSNLSFFIIIIIFRSKRTRKLRVAVVTRSSWKRRTWAATRR